MKPNHAALVALAALAGAVSLVFGATAVDRALMSHDELRIEADRVEHGQLFDELYPTRDERVAIIGGVGEVPDLHELREMKAAKWHKQHREHRRAMAAIVPD